MNVLLLLQLLMVRIATISIFVFILKFQFLHGFFKDLHPDDQVLCSFGQLSKEIKSAVSRTQVSNNLKSMYSFLFWLLVHVYNIDLYILISRFSKDKRWFTSGVWNKTWGKSLYTLDLTYMYITNFFPM